MYIACIKCCGVQVSFLCMHTHTQPQYHAVCGVKCARWLSTTNARTPFPIAVEQPHRRHLQNSVRDRQGVWHRYIPGTSSLMFHVIKKFVHVVRQFLILMSKDRVFPHKRNSIPLQCCFPHLQHCLEVCDHSCWPHETINFSFKYSWVACSKSSFRCPLLYWAS